MAKYYGAIGYAEMVETSPGVSEEIITERSYYGDILRNARNLQSTEHLNDNVNVSNQISIVADPYAIANFHSIRYAVFMGTKWKVPTVDVQPPRLILSLGGLYNGDQT